MRRTLRVCLGASVGSVLLASGCSSSANETARPDTKCHPPASQARAHSTLVLSYRAAAPRLRVSPGSLVTVTAGPYYGQDLIFPSTRGSPVACRVSGHRTADGAVQIVLLARHPGRLILRSGELHPTPAMDPAFIGLLIVVH
jgi:hypothetical protein